MIADKKSTTLSRTESRSCFDLHELYGIITITLQLFKNDNEALPLIEVKSNVGWGKLGMLY